MKFLDSNVWFYAFVDSQDLSKHLRAKKLIALDDISISIQTIGEVCNSLLREASLDELEIRNIISSFYRRFRPIVLDEEDFLKGSELRLRYKFSHWDSLLVAAALPAKVSVLYSEDMHDGLVVEGTLTIRNPFK